MILLPYPCLQRSAECLDPVLRWRYVREVRRMVDEPPAEWRYHVPALKLYHNYLLSAIYKTRERLATEFGMYDLTDYSTHVRVWPDPRMPPWLDDPWLREADRLALLRRFPVFYGQYGWTEAQTG